ncbi:MAG: carboxyl transferase domain-containing protein, partial [Paracoccaceae bacterium]
MAVLTSSISPASDGFKANVAAHEAAMAPVQEAANLAIAGGGETARERHLSRGKILPRDRVARLLDPGSPFMEIGMFAAFDMYDGASPAGGAVAGIGRVAGRDV